MDLEAQIVEAIRDELQRQAEASNGGLKITGAEAGAVNLEGNVDLEAVAMVVAGAVAGGP